MRERLGHNRSELSFLRGDGTTFVADVASNVFTDENGELRTCVVFHDITEHLDEIERQVRLVEEFRGLSLVDELTGIRNRRGLMSGAEALLAIADRNHQSVQALFIDVDNLKELNDLHGHQAGDKALVALARALHDSVRAADLVARIGATSSSSWSSTPTTPSPRSSSGASSRRSKEPRSPVPSRSA